jgi:predicted YcjX-like family ATPase
MAHRFAKSGLKDFAGLGDLASLASPATLQRHAQDLANLALDRTLRLAVTGLRGGGKTVFITAITHHLLHGRELPFLSAVQDERLLGARLLPPREGDPPPFPFAEARAALGAAKPSWPAPTERLSTLRLRLRFVAKGALRRRLAEHRTLNLEIIDYPGEWLLDLPLLEQSYADWSAQTLLAAERPPRAELAKEWRSFLAELDPTGPADADQVARAAALYTRYLERCQTEAGLSQVQPGRFTMPGDLAGSELLQFCPLPPAGAPPKGGPWGARASSLGELMAERYEQYRDTVVRSFYRDHFSRFDRQIVLVDLLGALNRGRACFDDVEATLATVLRNFRYGPSGLLTRLFRPRIEVLLFAASKADHIAHNQHHNLRLLLEQMVHEAAGNARYEGIKPAFVSLAALRSTDVVHTDHRGQSLSCVRGVLKGEERETVLFPGEIPPDLPADDDWNEDRFRFRDFAPRRLLLQGTDKPQHIRLDQALEVLLGDRLQ